MRDDNFIMLPTVDFCFKELMENPKVRKGFIAALLAREPEEIRETKLLPTVLRKEAKEDKTGILDVKVELMDGTQMDLEMQVAYFEFWEKRVLYYLSKMYAGQLNRGESYEKLKKCIHVSILDFVLFPEDRECYRIIHLTDQKTGKVYTDLFEIQILELRKLPQKAVSADTTEDAIILWMRFFNGKKREEFANMAKANEYLDEAYRTLEELSADEWKRLEYEEREKALKDYNTQMGSALKRGEQYGIELGLKKGLKKGLKQGIKQGIERGMDMTLKVIEEAQNQKSPEEISRICELPLEQVEEILRRCGILKNK